MKIVDIASSIQQSFFMEKGCSVFLRLDEYGVLQIIERGNGACQASDPIGELYAEVNTGNIGISYLSKEVSRLFKEKGVKARNIRRAVNYDFLS